VYFEDQGSGKEDLHAEDLAPDEAFEGGTVFLIVLIFLQPKSSVMLQNPSIILLLLQDNKVSLQTLFYIFHQQQINHSGDLI
jgi:hypothetical protein